MNYIRITKENIDKEHICCAMSGRQSVAKKEWLRQRFDDGLVFYRSEERGKCFIEYIPAENAWVPIVKNKTGEVGSCDVPFSTDLAQFSADYLRLTHEVAESCENHDLTDSMVIGTSAIVDTEIDGAVGMNSGIFNNPFIIWGKYHKGLFRTTLKLSFQFHHTQIDGAHAGRFLARLQETINRI